MIKTLAQAIFVALVFCASPLGWAHKSSDAFIVLKQAQAGGPVQAELSFALRDLDRVFDNLDANNDRSLTLGEVKAAMPQILGWARDGMSLRCAAEQTGQEQRLAWAYQGLEQRSDGAFVRLEATSGPCQTDQGVAVRYTLMQGVDADHRAVLAFEWPKLQGSVALKPATSWVEVAGQINSSDNQGAGVSVFSTLKSYIVLGIGHIGSGADHIAFVICLVLSLALSRAQDRKSLLVTVTAFTLGHSITLIAATLGWVGSPVWVEPMIAVSIGIAAAFNLVPASVRAVKSVWLKSAVASLFGLVHGLGFSGAMTDAKVPDGALFWALAGFNIGVEIGQLLIISAWALVYFSLYRWSGYTRYVVRGGSVWLVLLSGYWFLQRTGFLA